MFSEDNTPKNVLMKKKYAWNLQEIDIQNKNKYKKDAVIANPPTLEFMHHKWSIAANNTTLI